MCATRFAHVQCGAVSELHEVGVGTVGIVCMCGCVRVWVAEKHFFLYMEAWDHLFLSLLPPLNTTALTVFSINTVMCYACVHTQELEAKERQLKEVSTTSFFLCAHKRIPHKDRLDRSQRFESPAV